MSFIIFGIWAITKKLGIDSDGENPNQAVPVETKQQQVDHQTNEKPTTTESSTLASGGEDAKVPQNEGGGGRENSAEMEEALSGKEEGKSPSDEEELNQENQESEESSAPIDIEKQQENLEKQILHSLISLLMKVSSYLLLTTSF